MRDWPSFDRIVEVLKLIKDDETLRCSGKPVGVFPTHEDARVRSILTRYPTGNMGAFNALDKEGLMMYGQMTAGSWIYIGSQGIGRALMRLLSCR